PYVNKRSDLTREKTHTLSPLTQNLLKSMDKGPVNVTYYINAYDNADYGLFDPPMQYFPDARVWDEYRAYKPDINVEFKYYYDKRGGEPNVMKTHPGLTERQIAEKYAGIKDVPFWIYKTPQEMDSLIDLSFEEYRHVARLEYQGKTTFLR